MKAMKVKLESFVLSKMSKCTFYCPVLFRIWIRFANYRQLHVNLHTQFKYEKERNRKFTSWLVLSRGKTFIFYLYCTAWWLLKIKPIAIFSHIFLWLHFSYFLKYFEASNRSLKKRFSKSFDKIWPLYGITNFIITLWFFQYFSFLI